MTLIKDADAVFDNGSGKQSDGREHERDDSCDVPVISLVFEKSWRLRRKGSAGPLASSLQQNVTRRAGSQAPSVPTARRPLALQAAWSTVPASWLPSSYLVQLFSWGNSSRKRGHA